MSTPAGGWVKLWRAWRDHDMARDPNATLLFLHLLCRAAWEPRVNRRFGYTLQPGELDETIEQLATATGLTYQAVKEAFKRLVKYGTLKRTLHHNPRRTVTTLVNWASYQTDSPATPEDAPDEQPTNNRRTTDPEEVKAIQEPEERKTTTNDARALAAYARECCSLTVPSQEVVKLLKVYGNGWVVEALEHLASRDPDARFAGIDHPDRFVKSLCKKAREQDGLERDGEYEPFENWRRRQDAAADAKLKAITGGAR